MTHSYLWLLLSPFMGYRSLICSSHANFSSILGKPVFGELHLMPRMVSGSSTKVLQGVEALILQYLEAGYDARDSKLKFLLIDADLSPCHQMDGLPNETIQLHQIHGGIHGVRCRLVLQA